MCSCICTSMGSYICECICRPEVSPGVVPQELSTLFSCASFHWNLRLTHLASWLASEPQGSVFHHCSVPIQISPGDPWGVLRLRHFSICLTTLTGRLMGARGTPPLVRMTPTTRGALDEARVSQLGYLEIWCLVKMDGNRFFELWWQVRAVPAVRESPLCAAHWASSSSGEAVWDPCSMACSMILTLGHLGTTVPIDRMDINGFLQALCWSKNPG